MTSGKLLKLTGFGQVKRWGGMVLIAIAVTGTLFHDTSRPGFWGSLVFVGVIGIVTFMMQRFVWKPKKQAGRRGRPAKSRVLRPKRTT